MFEELRNSTSQESAEVTDCNILLKHGAHFNMDAYCPLNMRVDTGFKTICASIF